MPPLWAVERRCVFLQLLCLQPTSARHQIQPFSQLFRAWCNLLGPREFCTGHSDLRLCERKEKLIRILWFPECGRAPEEPQPSQQGEWADREEKPQEGPHRRVSLLPSAPAAPIGGRPLSLRAVPTVRNFFLSLPKARAWPLKQPEPWQRHHRGSWGHWQDRPSPPCSTLQPTGNPKSSVKPQHPEWNLATPQQGTIPTSRDRYTKAWFDAADQIKNRMKQKEDEIWRDWDKNNRIPGDDQLTNVSQPEKIEISREVKVWQLGFMVCSELTKDGLFPVFQGVWNQEAKECT